MLKRLPFAEAGVAIVGSPEFTAAVSNRRVWGLARQRCQPIDSIVGSHNSIE
jgi:hypothetical protein